MNPSPKDNQVGFDLFGPIPPSFLTSSFLPYLLPHWGRNSKPFISQAGNLQLNYILTPKYAGFLYSISLRDRDTGRKLSVYF